MLKIRVDMGNAINDVFGDFWHKTFSVCGGVDTHLGSHFKRYKNLKKLSEWNLI